MHEESDRPLTAQQSNLISGSAAGMDVRAWYYHPTLHVEGLGVPGQADGWVGPVSKVEVRGLIASGKLSRTTAVWAPGMKAPVVLAASRELRWWSASGRGVGGLGGEGREGDVHVCDLERGMDRCVQGTDGCLSRWASCPFACMGA